MPRLESAPTLAPLRDEIKLLLIHLAQWRIRHNRIAMLAVAAVLVIFLTVYELVGANSDEPYLAASLTLVASYAAEAFILIYVGRRVCEYDCALRLFRVAAATESAASRYWGSSAYRLALARDLEKAAGALEHATCRFTRISRKNRLDLSKLGRVKAAGIRELEVWLIKPHDSTASDLVKRLTDDLKKLLDGRWYELPDGPSPDELSIRQRAVLLIGGFLALAAMAAVLAYASKIGGVAPILTTLFGGAGVALLTRGGMKTGDIARYLNIGKV